jgi:hypothetical protein
MTKSTTHIDLHLDYRNGSHKYTSDILFLKFIVSFCLDAKGPKSQARPESSGGLAGHRLPLCVIPDILLSRRDTSIAGWLHNS